MNYYIFSIFDKKASLYSELKLDVNYACGERWFSDIVGRVKTDPSDFELYCIGMFDTATGVVELKAKPEFVVSGANAVSQ